MSRIGDTRAACTQISMTCTTSMTDWVHGDLWLCSDGLLRRSRGWRATTSNVDNRGARQIVDPREIRPTQAFSTEERLQIAASDKRNWWIPWDQIAEASLAMARSASESGSSSTPGGSASAGSRVKAALTASRRRWSQSSGRDSRAKTDPDSPAYS